jgi:hypothetical protein
MRPHHFLFVSLPLLLASASGCAPGPYGYAHVCAPVHSRTDRAIVAAADAILAIAEVAQAVQEAQSAQASAEDDDPSGDPPLRVRLGPIPPHEPAAAADTRVESRTPFDLGGAYGALANVDLDACKVQGLAPGYGRVEIAFVTDGSPRDVRLTLPTGSTDSARACVESAFQQMRVAPFDGAEATIKRPFYVHG